MDKPVGLLLVATEDVDLSNGLKIQAGHAFVVPLACVNVYNLGLEANDMVTVRTTDEDVPLKFRGLSARVLSTMELVNVELADGSVETFNRNQLKLRRRDGFDTHQIYNQLPPMTFSGGDDDKPWEQK